MVKVKGENMVVTIIISAKTSIGDSLKHHNFSN